MSKKPFIALLIMGLSFISAGHLSASQNQIIAAKGIAETPIKAELIWSVGSDKENENFYKPGSFAVDKDGRVFVLDTKNSRVQVFSAEGKFLFSFARFGQGPGELTRDAMVIKIPEDQNICIIDVARVNVYDINGRFLKQFKLDDDYWDIELIAGKYYLPLCEMDKEKKTVHIFGLSGDKIGSIGDFIEPEEGIYNKINKVKDKFYVIDFFNTFPRIVKINDGEFLYSLFLPYRIIKYDLLGRVLKDFNGDMDYGINQIFSISYYKDKIPFVMPNMPLPYIYSPYMKGDGTILVPFLKKEKDYLYIDHFDDQLKLIRRYKIQERLAEEGNLLKNVFIDKKNNLYCLITPDTSDDFPRVVKYRLVM